MAPRKNNEPASWELDRDKPKPKGETRIRRSYCAKDLTLRPVAGVDTVHDIMLYAGRTHGDKQGFGWRDVLEVYTDLSPASSIASSHTGGSRSTGTTTSKGPSVKEKYRLGPLRWMTYLEALQEVRDLGSGLRELGAGTSSHKGFFGIYAATSCNWMMMAQACAFNAVPICTLYDTLAVEAIANALSETQVHGMFTNAELLPNVERIIAKAPTVKLIVYDGVADAAVLEAFKWCQDLEVVHIDEVRRIGLENQCQAVRARREDVYCCMYTSGGGGKPKGALLTHGNVCSAAGSAWRIMNDVLEKEEVYLAFLPQAHIMEFAVEMTFIAFGLPIAYGRIKTLTDAGVRGCKSDIMEVRPSMMVAVPQVWEIIRKGIVAKVDESGKVKKGMFNLAIKAKSKALENSIPGVASVANTLVFNRVRASTGGRLRTLLNGGGPVARTTQQFLSAALVQMIQGYGLTEGTAMACLMHPHWRSYGAVGGPVPGAEMKLVDRLEDGLGYSTDNDPPQGEIYLRGPAVFKGYYNRPHLDAAAFTADKWFKTGDIGQINKDGTFTIIDRIKNHVRLAGGTYVALERLEAVYKSCSFIFNAMVMANPRHRHPALIAVAHPAGLPNFARKNGITDWENIEALCTNTRFVDLCLQELNSHAKKEGLKGQELLEALILTTDEWTPESGLLTAAQKLKRTIIEQHYADSIRKVYRTNVEIEAKVSIEQFPLPPMMNGRV